MFTTTEAEMDSMRYARILKKRLAELEARRKVEIKKWHAGVAVWRRKLADFLRTKGPERAKSIAVSKDKEHYNYGRRRSFDIGEFFSDAPVPPAYPSDEQIREIKKMIRFIAVTEKAKVKIRPDDIEKLLADPAPAE